MCQEGFSACATGGVESELKVFSWSHGGGGGGFFQCWGPVSQTTFNTCSMKNNPGSVLYNLVDNTMHNCYSIRLPYGGRGPLCCKFH